MLTNPGNPEYHLRLLHIQAVAGDESKAEQEEQILAAMMDGPLSETIGRVKEIGRGLMPGHHLFDDSAQAEEAQRIIAEKTGATGDFLEQSLDGEPVDDRIPQPPGQPPASDDMSLDFDLGQLDLPPDDADRK